MEFYRADLLGGSDKLTLVAGPVLLKDGQVLLSKEKDESMWKFPGGTVRDTESFRETVLRELKEESNLEAELVGDPIIRLFERDREGTFVHYILIHYLAQNPVGDIKINDDEVEKVQYFDIDDLPENVAPNVAAVLEEVNSK